MGGGRRADLESGMDEMRVPSRGAEEIDTEAPESEEIEAELEDLSDDEEDVELPADPGVSDDEEESEW
jgi:hypothetical protein